MVTSGKARSHSSNVFIATLDRNAQGGECRQKLQRVDIVRIRNHIIEANDMGRSTTHGPGDVQALFKKAKVLHKNYQPREVVRSSETKEGYIMNAKIIVAGVLGLLVASIFVCLPMNASASGPDFSMPGSTYVATGPSYTYGCYKVNRLDTVTFTWTGGSNFVSYNWTLQIKLGAGFLDWSSNLDPTLSSGLIGSDPYQYLMPYSYLQSGGLYGSGPMSFTSVAAGDGVLTVFISIQLQATVNFNVAITPGNSIFKQLSDLSATMNNTILGLTDRLSSVEDKVGQLNQQIVSMNQQISSINTKIIQLQNDLHCLNNTQQSEYNKLLLYYDTLARDMTNLSYNFSQQILSIESNRSMDIFNRSMDISNITNQLEEIRMSVDGIMVNYTVFQNYTSDYDIQPLMNQLNKTRVQTNDTFILINKTIQDLKYKDNTLENNINGTYTQQSSIKTDLNDAIQSAKQLAYGGIAIGVMGILIGIIGIAIGRKMKPYIPNLQSYSAPVPIPPLPFPPSIPPPDMSIQPALPPRLTSKTSSADIEESLPKRTQPASVQLTYCGHCGKPSAPDMKFCHHCGNLKR